MKVEESQAKKPEHKRVSHRKELAVITLATVASIAGVGGLLLSGQQGTHQAVQSAATASPSGTSNNLGGVPTTSQRGDVDGEINDDGEGRHAVLRPSKAKPAQSGAPSWSVPSQTPAPAVSRGTTPL